MSTKTTTTQILVLTEIINDGNNYQVLKDYDANSNDMVDLDTEKERQIKWSKNMAQLRKRFHDIFNLDGLTVAEIRFSSMSAEY